MEVAVLDSKELVVNTTNTTDYVNSSSTEAVVVDNNSTTFITVLDQQSVLVEVDRSQVVVAGIMGPPGKDGTNGIAEEDMVYSKRIDFISDNELYKAEAQVGSAESAAVWRIRKVTIASDGDIAELWAGGTAEFDKSWTNRLTYNYS